MFFSNAAVPFWQNPMAARGRKGGRQQSSAARHPEAEGVVAQLQQPSCGLSLKKFFDFIRNDWVNIDSGDYPRHRLFDKCFGLLPWLDRVLHQRVSPPDE